MNKIGSDPKVKKTLVRNCEKKAIRTARKPVVRDVGNSSRDLPGKVSGPSMKENELNQPTLCSSEMLANYLADVKISAPPLLTAENQNIDENLNSAKMTKKLNFHFNDRIYRNLIELNASSEDFKKKKDKRPSSSSTSIKRDLEPNLEDFYEDIKDKDSSPNIPIIKPKLKTVKKVENGDLHKLVAVFEDL